MSKLLHIVAPLLAVLLALTGCKKTPEGVIEPERMARIMADVHLAEGIVERDHRQYPNDSTRIALRQAIYARYGATSADVDSSFMWYGQHMDQYMEVYDRTIELLQEQLNAANAEVGIAARAMMGEQGDSVDVWQMARYAVLTPRMPSPYVHFEVPLDAEALPGDRYALRMKIVEGTAPTDMMLAVEYDDGTAEWVQASLSNANWRKVELMTDSTRTASRIYGNLRLAVDEKEGAATKGLYAPNTFVYIDSIYLVRRQLDTEIYNRRYQLRHAELPATIRERRARERAEALAADTAAMATDTIAAPVAQ